MLILNKLNLSALKEVAKFTSHDKTRPSICGVRVIAKANEPIVMVATDGRRLIQVAMKRHICEADAEFTIPTYAISAIMDYDLSVALMFENNKIELLAPNFTLSCGAIEDTYPNYKQVIPSPMPTLFVGAEQWIGNASFLRDCTDALAYFSSGEMGCRIVAEGAISPICFLADNSRAEFIALLMPVRI